MLIEQMKLHPEEFRGSAGKFTQLLDTAREVLQGQYKNLRMSKRDAAAVLDAAEEHLYEVWLAEEVLLTLMTPKPEVNPPPPPPHVPLPPLGTRTSWFEQERGYRLEHEMRQLEAFKRRELELDMGNIKIFNPFI